MITKKADDLHVFIRSALMSAGADDRNATRVAEALVLSNLRGVDTHGILHLPSYVDGIKRAEILPQAWPEILEEDNTTARVGGNWTFGFVTAKFAMDVAISKAEQHNVSVVSAVQLNHIGRLGEYAEMAASKGLISMIWAGGFAVEAPVTVPFGGRERVLSTNPLAMGFPVGNDAPVIIDYATTAVAGSKVILAKDKNELLPPDSVVDKDGNLSNDPAAYYDGGALLPFGGHKGFALMLAVELFGRIVAGSDAFADELRGGPVMRHHGLTMIALRADVFQSASDYSKIAKEFGNQIRAVPPANGFNEVIMPGDLESRAQDERSRDGIPIPDATWERLTKMADSLGVDVP